MTIRAVRNNNPGNLEKGERWQGLLSAAHMTPAQAAEKRFAVFSAPKWGFRALATVLRNYEKLHGLTTIRQIINRWAPPVENDTGSYVAHVAKDTGRDPDEALDLSDADTLAGLCCAISKHECGGWFFTEADLDEGVALAISGSAALTS